MVNQQRLWGAWVWLCWHAFSGRRELVIYPSTCGVSICKTVTQDTKSKGKREPLTRFPRAGYLRGDMSGKAIATDRLRAALEARPEVAFAYLFGSGSRGRRP